MPLFKSVYPKKGERLMSARSLPGVRFRTLHLTIAEGVVILTYAAVVIFTTLQVIFRYAVGSSLPWTEELARYSFIWLVYASMVLGLHQGAHASLNLLFSKVQGVPRNLVVACIHLLTIALFATLLWEGLKLVDMVKNQNSPALRMSIMLPYSALPFGCFLMLVEEAFQIVEYIRTGKTPLDMNDTGGAA